MRITRDKTNKSKSSNNEVNKMISNQDKANSEKVNKNKVKGYIMAGAGFFMILVNGLDYLLGWDKEFTPIGIIGLVFVVIGMNRVKGKK